MTHGARVPPEHTPRYWVRRAIMKGSPSAERRFLDRFRASLDIGLLETELATCLDNPGPRPCGYVGRTLFRFAPELRQRGREDEIAKLLESDPRLSLEHAFFTSSVSPRWWATVVARNSAAVRSAGAPR